MKKIHATYTASISELKQNPTALLNQSEGEVIAILNHNRPTAYLIPAYRYEDMMRYMDDYDLKRLLTEAGPE